MKLTRRLRTLLPHAVGCALVLLEWSPMVASYPHTPDYDGRFFFHQFEIAKVSLTRHGELALWNPFDCRGIAMWDHPESTVAAPLALLTTLFDSLVTIYIWNIVHALAGWFGMWLFARRDMGFRPAAAFVAAAMWSVGAWHITQTAGSHETFVSFFLLPLLLYFWRGAERSARAVAGAALTLGWMVFHAGTYAVPFTLVALAFEMATRCRPWSRAKRVLGRSAAIGVIAFAICACRLLPIADQLAHHARPIAPDTDHLLRASTLAKIFFFHERDPLGIGLAGQQYGADEYIVYFGFAGVLVAAIGSVLAWRAGHRWPHVLAGGTAVLALGHFASWSPWSLLQHYVFPFTAMRVSSRFLLVVAFVMCIWMGAAVDLVEDAIARWTGARAARVGRTLLLGGALLAIAETLAVGRVIAGNRFTKPPQRHVVESPRFYYGADGLEPEYIDQPRQNRAWGSCRAAGFVYNQDAPVWSGDWPQALPVDYRSVVRDDTRTNNTIRFRLDATEPAEVRIDSAYAAGWQTNVGQLFERDHLLMLRVEPGIYEVRLHYWPRTLTLGLFVSGAGLVVALFLCLRRRDRQGKTIVRGVELTVT